MLGPPAKVVARYADGRLVKGYSYDFTPGRRRFHIFSARDASDDPTPIVLSELKAVFVVRDFMGNAAYREHKSFRPGQHSHGRRVRVLFRDGEVLAGSIDGDIASPSGLWMTPADPASNNIRVYAVPGAIRSVRYVLEAPPALPTPRTRASTPPLGKRLLAWLQQPITLPGPQLRRRAAR